MAQIVSLWTISATATGDADDADDVMGSVPSVTAAGEGTALV